MAVPPILLILTGIKFDPIFKGTLRAALIDGRIEALRDKSIEVVHGLYIKELH